jgi:branched-chain amino acid transport system ATP-binding protein
MQLSVKNLSVNYGGVRAFSGVSIEVPDRSVSVLIGANGAGKSSLIRCIIGLVKRSGGEIWLGDRRIDGVPARKMASLGLSLVPEGRRVFGYMTVQENLLMGAFILRSKKEIKDALNEVLELLPVLKERRRQLAGSLSGGEQQMVAIGRALMGRPRLMLLDEPSLGLAPIVVNNLAKFLTKLNRERGLTLLMAEQNVRMGLRIAHKGYVLENGAVTMEGRGDELLRSDHVIRAYLGGSQS